MKFIDLFAGIGGLSLPFHELGFECVFASEINLSARKTYQTNFHQPPPISYMAILLKYLMKTFLLMTYC